VTGDEPTNNAADDHMEYAWIGFIDQLIELTTSRALDGPLKVAVMRNADFPRQNFSSMRGKAHSIGRVKVGIDPVQTFTINSFRIFFFFDNLNGTCSSN